MGHSLRDIGREAKPRWPEVPDALKRRVNAALGSRVVRAGRMFGGYGPSATFMMTLEDGRRVFFKGVYPLPRASSVRWSLDREERVYQELSSFIGPWAPLFFGSVREDGWHALLLEAVPGQRMPPWTTWTAARVAHSYADFHASTFGRPLPRWLPRRQHLEFAGFWRQIAADDAGRIRLAALAAGRGGEARTWLVANMARLAAAEVTLEQASEPFALLHFDTRSDNIRLDGDLLRMFDWPSASVGPAEFDLAAFAQSIESEGGPHAEMVVDAYAARLAVRPDVLVGSIAGIAGYFADRAPRPDLPELPRLRSVQRRQLKASLAWSARALDLPEPRWLSAVPD